VNDIINLITLKQGSLELRIEDGGALLRRFENEHIIGEVALTAQEVDWLRNLVLLTASSNDREENHIHHGSAGHP
jgi:hypothetical protein